MDCITIGNRIVVELITPDSNCQDQHEMLYLQWTHYWKLDGVSILKFYLPNLCKDLSNTVYEPSKLHERMDDVAVRYCYMPVKT